MFQWEFIIPEPEEAEEDEGVEAAVAEDVVVGEAEGGEDPGGERGAEAVEGEGLAGGDASGEVDGGVARLPLQHGEERQHHHRQPQVDPRRRHQALRIHHQNKLLKKKCNEFVRDRVEKKRREKRVFN